MDTSSSAILQAVEEYNPLGQETFLTKYGFGRAREFFLDYNGNLYDSKAIVSTAHGYQFPCEGTLGPHDFSGGEATVQRSLESLSFMMCVLGKRR